MSKGHNLLVQLKFAFYSSPIIIRYLYHPVEACSNNVTRVEVAGTKQLLFASISCGLPSCSLLILSASLVLFTFVFGNFWLMLAGWIPCWERASHLAIHSGFKYFCNVLHCHFFPA